MNKIFLFLLVFGLSFFNFEYARALPQPPIEVASEEEIVGFYKLLQEEIDNQEIRIQELQNRLNSHQTAPSQIMMAQLSLAITMLDVKQTLFVNIQDSTCLNSSDFRQEFILIFCKESITKMDLLQIQHLINIYKF